MKAILVITLLFALAVAFTGSTSAQTPPGVAVRFTSTFENVQPPARHFNLLHGVSEFRPGEAARSNSTDSHRFFTTLEGELTVVIGDKTQKFKSGEKWHVPSGVYFGIGNEGSVDDFTSTFTLDQVKQHTNKSRANFGIFGNIVLEQNKTQVINCWDIIVDNINSILKL